MINRYERNVNFREPYKIKNLNRKNIVSQFIYYTKFYNYNQYLNHVPYQCTFFKTTLMSKSSKKIHKRQSFGRAKTKVCLHTLVLRSPAEG